MKSSFIAQRYGVEIDLCREGKTQCPRCAHNGKDNSHNNLMVYGLDENGKHRGFFCWSCEFKMPSQQWLEDNGEIEEEEYEEIVGSHFDKEVNEKIKKQTGVESKGYRGIRTETSRPFGVRYAYSEADGSVQATYYPCTEGYDISGYKVRKHPKDFSSPVGETGKDCELFGQFRFKTNSHTVVIVGGEHDCLAAFQMLSDAQKNKNFDPVAVVSPTIGESGAYKQVQKQYAFFNQFKKCIIAMDEDEAGQTAAEKIAKVLPRGKAYIMKMRLKDPNQFVLEGREQEFISDFWAAQPYTPAGVHASTALYRATLDRMDLDMITLPPFMKKAGKMLGEGIVKREITLILAKTSIGKKLVLSCQWRF